MTAHDAKRLQEAEGSPPGIDWNAVYADQLPRVYNYFRFRAARSHDVEELTARTFEKAWRARAKYRRDLAGFSTWLFAIARNVMTDQLRADALRTRAATWSEPIEQVTPEGNAMHGSDMERLATLTAGLADRHKELIALKYGAALSNRMIARVTGLSESNVGTTLQRTVERLRARW
ncbi:MAG TPA: sigma-70 family RNA polymerase sigma factor [Steroidobacteraceae bacterium]|jgi:RNA polymerase sigma-70 factor (ECF subfamily)|nr:sigma-70 family RNA polymerase sigma factor [Steroidobacteraceae bacterium]